MQGTTCITMLALMCGVTMGTPVRTSRDPSSVPDVKTCTPHARTLLTTLKNILNKTQEKTAATSTLFHGFNCTDLGAEVIPNERTVAVCQPYEDATCSDQRTHSFSETECLKSIGEDLRHHHSNLDNYVKSLDPKFNSATQLEPIMKSIRDLQQNCPVLLTGEMEEPTTNNLARVDSFEARKSLCKQLQGFHLRVITINRALGYIGAGEYKK
ncbi:interleukin-12 subunit alpha [Brachyhypopomus gauderio]|uniref:interleukin-12 subunit alpha n=1 Tax=Brachyhypopomus gauderio TaxID=698409 RepID=UPI004042D3B1